MGYTVERGFKPPTGTRSTRVNPIAVQMRRLKVGESFVVPEDDHNWRSALLANENYRRKGHFCAWLVEGGRRIYRDR